MRRSILVVLALRVAPASVRAGGTGAAGLRAERLGPQTTGQGGETVTNERSSWRNEGGVPLHYRPAKVEDHTPLRAAGKRSRPGRTPFGRVRAPNPDLPKSGRPPAVKSRRAARSNERAHRDLTAGPTVCSP